MKNKVVKKMCSLFLASVLAVSMVGCGVANQEDDKTSLTQSSETPENKESEVEEEQPKEPVTLTWYFCNGVGEQEDTKKVEDRVNEMLKEVEGLEHVSIDLVPGTYEYANEVLLAQTSGKQIDLLHTYRLSYTTEIANDTFIAIDDYLESEDFVALKEELPDWLWNSMKVNGETYIIPTYQMGATERYVVIPKEYEQYLTNEDIAVLENMNLRGENAAAELEKLLVVVENLTAAVSDATGKEYYNTPAASSVADVTNFISRDRLDAASGLSVYAGTTEATFSWLSDSMKTACEYVAKWVEEGTYPADASVQDTSKWGIQYGETARHALDLGYQSNGTAEYVAEQYLKSFGMDVMVYPMHDSYFMEYNWGAGGTGITASCEHPYEALLFLQLINTEAGQEIYNTLVWGLEGEHWEWEDKSINRIKTLEYDSAQAGKDASYTAWKWIIGNTEYQYLNQAVSDDTVELMREVNDDPNNAVSMISGFALDKTNVETEFSQVTAVVSEYKDALIYGSMGAKWEEYYDEFVKKLEAAGLQTILDEIQAQIDSYLEKQ